MVALDKKDAGALRIVSQKDQNQDEDQGLAVTEASTPSAVVGSNGQGDDPTSERFLCL